MDTSTDNELTRLWGQRVLLQVALRWAVPPLIVALSLIARAVGFELPLVPLLLIALSVLGYNVLFNWIARRSVPVNGEERAFDLVLALAGICADYTALLAMLHFTGGASSPLLVLLIIHVIVAAIQFRPVFSYGIAAIAVAGLWLLVVARSFGWLPATVLMFRGEQVFATGRPQDVFAGLLIFTATLILTAGIASWIMRRFKRRVSELVEERTQFMLQTAHNMRAPLGAGLSMLDLVKEGYGGPVAAGQKELLGKIDARLRALYQTIGEMLTIAKARDWSREITDVIVDLGELAAWTEAMFREAAESKEIRLEIRVDPDLPDIDSGADLLEQMMQNLVSNAIKYTPRHGSVRVRFSQIEPGEIRITVEDTGIGIPLDEQHKLFQEYFRATNAKRASAAGTGLGLTLVRKTVDRHRGRIHLSSEEGKGTRVVVDLPTRQPHSKAREAIDSRQPASPAAR